MIDFRYHLVSIIAVFLALAVGLVVGSTALSGKAEETLTLLQRRAIASNNSLTKHNQELANQVNADQAFAGASAQRLIGGLLAHDKVVLVVAPGANDTVTKGVAAALQQAGATVTGEVDLQSSFLTTSAATETGLTTLAQSLAGNAGLAPPVLSQSQVPGQQAVAAVLAASLLDPTAGNSTLSANASTDILTGLERQGFVSVSGTPAIATQAVLVAPGGAAPQAGGLVLVAVAAELSAASSGTVMAGAVESIGTGSIISTENNSPHPISTVDNADTETGQIIVVQALKNLLDGKPPSKYGVDPGTAPSPAPTPSLTPTTGTSSPAAGRH